MVAATAKAPLPNGTSVKWDDQKIKVSAWKGEIPVRAGVGRSRVPGPFDDIVGRVTGEGANPGPVTLVELTGEDVVKAGVKEIRRSANFHKRGLNIWVIEEGILFQCREFTKRPRKAKTEE